MKVALYLRCSTSKQDLFSQREALVKWATGQGHTYTLYEDYAISGKTTKRDGIDALMILARQGEFDLVGVLEISRIGRSVSFIHKTIEELSKLDVKVVLTNSNMVLDYTTLEGRALIGGLSLAADIEWMLIKERNERGRRKMKELGIKMGRKHKQVSQVAVDKMHRDGMSLRQIAAELGVSPATIMRRIKKEED